MWTELLEQAIIGMLVTALLNHEYRVEIEDIGDDIFIYAWSSKKRPEEFKKWIKIVSGNPPDELIGDYTTNLSRIVRKVQKFAELAA